MNASEVKVLENLLQKAMDSTVMMKDSSRDSQITTEMYLRLLRSQQQSYDPIQREHVARFHPEILDNSVREQLLNVIRTTLGQYIHNDMLQSAIIAATGGALDGFKVSKLMNHLITIALSRGAKHATRSFYKCAENTDVNIQFITLIDGIKVEHDIELSEGIHLVPIPNDTRDFPPYMITPSFNNYIDYFGRALIIIDERISPIFAHPSEMSPENFPGPFIRSNLNSTYRDFSVSEFCEALSLSTNHLVNDVAWWTHVNPDEAYAVSTSIQFPTYSLLVYTKNRALEVNGEDIHKAMSLYTTRKNLRSEIAQKLRVPIDRWRRSKMDANPVDVFINLGTALESLYLNDTGNAGELRFRMALRAAWHLGNGSADRSLLFDDFKKIYDRRSKSVHTGILTQDEQAPEFMTKAQELCMKSIVRIINDGEIPNWNQLVMGG